MVLPVLRGEESGGLTMIHIPTYEVLCSTCRAVIDSAPTLAEALEIESTGRGCIVVDGRVYCSEECKEKAEG